VLLLLYDVYFSLNLFDKSKSIVDFCFENKRFLNFLYFFNESLCTR